MTRLKEMRPELIVVSAPDGSSKEFKEEDGDILWSEDDIPIQLHYHPLGKARLKEKPRDDGRPVLLLHGASAGADTFLVPRNGEGVCFVDYLLRENYEPWLLDWRASKEVAETIIKTKSGSDLKEIVQQLNFNSAAKHDIKRALDAISALRSGQPIDVVAHCMGGAVMAEALLDPNIQLFSQLSHVVLSTIGVFYQMNLHGRLKAEAHLLKRVRDEEDEPHHFLDPRIDPGKMSDEVEGGSPRPLPKDNWPKFLDNLYKAWRVPYDQSRMNIEKIPEDEHHVFEMFNRLSFMFGEPYQEGNLAPEIHHRLWALTIKAETGDIEPIAAGSLIEVGDRDMGEVAYDFQGKLDKWLLICRPENAFEVGQVLSADGRLIGWVDAIDANESGVYGPMLPTLFGKMSLDLFRHGAENLRAGMATKLQAGDEHAPKPILDDSKSDDVYYKGFEQLDHLTLIGGGLNRLWHRDSIDRMADWLDRSSELRGKCEKKIFLDYGHQDLFWGRNAAEDVFPVIIKGLGPRPLEDEPVNGSSGERDQDGSEKKSSTAA